MPYIYESHMGGLYTEDEPLSYDEEYCEECGDSDSLLGYARDKKSARELLKPLTNINGSGGYKSNYIKEFINSNFNKR